MTAAAARGPAAIHVTIDTLALEVIDWSPGVAGRAIERALAHELADVGAVEPRARMITFLDGGEVARSAGGLERAAEQISRTVGRVVRGGVES